MLGTSPKHIVATPRPSSLLRSLGIHHILLNFPLGNLKTTIICLQLYNILSVYMSEKTLITYRPYNITFIYFTPSDLLIVLISLGYLIVIESVVLKLQKTAFAAGFKHCLKSVYNGRLKLRFLNIFLCKG